MTWAILGVSGYYLWAAVQRNALALLQAYASEYTVLSVSAQSAGEVSEN
ncbi:hypothetical protein [Thiomonas sp. X19]|nr:hypothetical protein [Thiomonas sp. X19]